MIVMDGKYRLESVIPDLGSLIKTARLVSIFNRFNPPPKQKQEKSIISSDQ